MRRAVVALSCAAGCGLALWLARAEKSSEPAPTATPASPSATAREPRSSAPAQSPEQRRSERALGPSESPYATEEDFLRDLEALRQRDKSAALELARKGDAWYPDTGVFAEARQAVVASLLVDLGRMKEARAEVRRFLEKYPESRYRPMLQGLTGIHPRPGAPPGVSGTSP